MKIRPLALLLFSLVLFACAAPAPTPTPEPVAMDPTVLRQQMAVLPGATVSPGESLTVTYPDETLFAEGAALPLPGGTAVLDPLATLLLSHTEVRAKATVRAQTNISADYDQALAQKRAELLGRFFRNRGIPEKRLSFTSEAGDGAPLELTLEKFDGQPMSDSRSAREK